MEAATSSNPLNDPLHNNRVEEEDLQPTHQGIMNTDKSTEPSHKELMETSHKETTETAHKDTVGEEESRRSNRQRCPTEKMAAFLKEEAQKKEKRISPLYEQWKWQGFAFDCQVHITFN